MQAIEYTAPNTINEAVQAMASKGPRARALAGGTDILVLLRGGRRSADLIVDMKNIPELTELSYNPQKGLTLGA
ncbi:MAG TPA: FAD binding domain-containing protein, partial [Dehalococcoidia bacterium]|nr:FAD binding domain-containing protein [Dehalococcoidia bacterium]